MAGWVACRGPAIQAAPADVERSLTMDDAGNVLIRNRRGEHVAVAYLDLPLLAIKLAEAWGTGMRPDLSDTERIKASTDVVAAWDRAL
jgi:hypothetical protein